MLQAGRSLPCTVAKTWIFWELIMCARFARDCASVTLWCAEKPTWMAGEGRANLWRQWVYPASIRSVVCGEMRNSLRDWRWHQRNSPHAHIGRELFAQETCFEKQELRRSFQPQKEG